MASPISQWLAKLLVTKLRGPNVLVRCGRCLIKTGAAPTCTDEAVISAVNYNLALRGFEY